MWKVVIAPKIALLNTVDAKKLELNVHLFADVAIV